MRRTGQWNTGPAAANKTGAPVQPQQPNAGQWNPQPMMGMSMTSAPMTMQSGQMAYRPMVPMAPMTAMTAPYTANQPMNVRHDTSCLFFVLFFVWGGGICLLISKSGDY